MIKDDRNIVRNKQEDSSNFEKQRTTRNTKEKGKVMIQIVPLFVSALALLSTVSAHVDEWCDKEYGAPNSTYKECVHGEFRCTENSTDRCNWGVWKVDPCAIGTRCLACGDYECVLDFQFEDLSKQLCPPYEKMMEEKKQQKEKGKVEGPCEHGAFRCTNNSTDRCDHGVWFSHPCVQGTKCLGCGDWECIRVEEFPMWEQMLCTPGTIEDDKKHMEHRQEYEQKNEDEKKKTYSEWEQKKSVYSGAQDEKKFLTIIAVATVFVFMVAL